MQEKTFNKLLDERMDEIQEISKKIKYNNLTYHYVTPGITPTNFIEFRGPYIFLKKQKNVIKQYKQQKKNN